MVYEVPQKIRHNYKNKSINMNLNLPRTPTIYVVVCKRNQIISTVFPLLNDFFTEN